MTFLMNNKVYKCWNADVLVGVPGTLLRMRAESAETDLVVTVFVGELVDLGAELIEVAVQREVGLHDVLALGGQSHMTSAYSAFALRAGVLRLPFYLYAKTVR